MHYAVHKTYTTVFITVMSSSLYVRLKVTESLKT